MSCQENDRHPLVTLVFALNWLFFTESDPNKAGNIVIKYVKYLQKVSKPEIVNLWSGIIFIIIFKDSVKKGEGLCTIAWSKYDLCIGANFLLFIQTTCVYHCTCEDVYLKKFEQSKWLLYFGKY